MTAAFPTYMQACTALAVAARRDQAVIYGPRSGACRLRLQLVEGVWAALPLLGCPARFLRDTTIAQALFSCSKVGLRASKRLLIEALAAAALLGLADNLK